VLSPGAAGQLEGPRAGGSFCPLSPPEAASARKSFRPPRAELQHHQTGFSPFRLFFRAEGPVGAQLSVLGSLAVQGVARTS